ncbi:branched-chain amino acid ABC transporter permease [Oscillospiraceae bacterium HV4-5-C5C]|nr:branched-chain amino acid ABC transporter permease [Oscillospiraceae bacterium HV4-5-C5C]
MPKKKIRSYLINLAAAAFVFIVVYLALQLGWINSYYRSILILICINSIMTISLNLATGLLGELCLGHAGFMAVGAYTTALISLNSGLPTYVGLTLGILAGAVTAGIAAVLVGIPALRLRGDYLAIITLAFGQIITILIRSLGFTGGALGLNGIPLTTDFPLTYWMLIVTMYIVYALIRSRQGRAILAIREDDIAAEASGINVTRYKMLAFVISAMLAGVAGALYAHYQGVLTPEKFDYNYSIDFMVMVVFGGMGSITGSILAAIVLTILPQLLYGFSDYRMLLYSILLIALMIFKPSGLLGQKELSQRVFQRLGRQLLGKKPQTVPVEADIPTTVVDEDTYLTEQGSGDSGVGGSSTRGQENLPVSGTPIAEAEGKHQERLGLDTQGDEPLTRKHKGRR